MDDLWPAEALCQAMAANLVLGRGHAEPVFDAEGPNSDLWTTANPNYAVFRRDYTWSTKFGMGARSEARNGTRITVNNNIHVFAVLQRLADHVTPNFEHAKATSPASHRAKPRSRSCSTHLGANTSYRAFVHLRLWHRQSQSLRSRCTIQIARPLISGLKTSAQLRVRRAQ